MKNNLNMFYSFLFYFVGPSNFFVLIPPLIARTSIVYTDPRDRIISDGGGDDQMKEQY